MGLFRKKADPLAQRSQTLNRRIAELEAEIARLNQTVTPGPARPAAPGRRPASSSAPGQPPGQAPGPAPGPHEPVFEPMPTRPLDPRPTPEPTGRDAVQLGLRRPAWSQWWRRLKGQFVDPPPANEKLVNYLAAGGIQGFRPLRFERRIARNRIVFICIVLGLLLWGLLVIFWHTR